MKFAFFASTIVALLASSSFANSNIVSTQSFLGQYSLVSTTSSYCSPNLRITVACDGLQISDMNLNDRETDRVYFCAINKGNKRNVKYSSGGHAIFPEVIYMRTETTLNSQTKTLKKVAAETSISISIFSSEMVTALTLENPDQILVKKYLTTNGEAAEKDDGQQCVYRRK